MADISSCGPIIERKYSQYKSAYISLCKKIKEHGGDEIIDPIDGSNIINDRFTDDEKEVLRILCSELVNKKIKMRGI
jgi:hypothetical protein